MTVASDTSTPLSLWRHRAFARVVVGSAISVLGDGVHSVALSLWVLNTTRSAAAMSAVMGTRITVGVLFGIVGGTLADRLDRARLMWVLDLLRALVVLMLIAAVMMPAVPFALVMTLTAILALAGEIRDPAFSASLVHLVGKDQVQQAGSMMQMLTTAARVAGPLFGGLLVTLLGVPAALVGDALSFAVSALCVLGAGKLGGTENRDGPRATFWSDIREGFSYVRSNALVRAIVILGPFLNFFGMSAWLLASVLAVKVWHAGATGLGLLEGILPFGFALGALFVMMLNARLKRRGLLIGLATTLSGPLIAVLGFLSSLKPALPVVLLIGFTLAIANVLLYAAMQTEVSADLQGRVFGTVNSLSNMVSPLAIFLSGVLADGIGPAPMLVVTGVALGACGTLGLTFLRGLRTYE